MDKRWNLWQEEETVVKQNGAEHKTEEVKNGGDEHASECNILVFFYLEELIQIFKFIFCVISQN